MTLEELQEIREQFRQLKSAADRSLAQTRDDELFVRLDEEANSIALIMKHVGGNLRSRWTDFLTSDGEKPDRHRDREFEIEPGEDKAAIVQRWEQGWRCVFDTLDSLSAEDLERTVTIRSEPHTVPQALVRSLTHTATHVGQITLLVKHLRSGDWNTLTIPRGKSDEYLTKMRQRFSR